MTNGLFCHSSFPNHPKQVKKMTKPPRMPLHHLFAKCNFDPFCFWKHRCDVRECFHALCVAVVCLFLPNFGMLTIWNLIESDINLKIIIVTVPIVLTVLQLEITLITMMAKNRTIMETIHQLQNVINRRKATFDDFLMIFPSNQLSSRIFLDL